MLSKVLLNFGILQARNIADSRTQLKRLVDNEGFPPGFMLGPNTRVWREEDVDAWLESRPSALDAKPQLRGIARVKHERRKATGGGA